MQTHFKYSITATACLMITSSVLAAAFPMYRDFVNKDTSCQCDYLIFSDRVSAPQRLVVDLGSPMLLVSNPRYQTFCKQQPIYQFLYGTPPAFNYCVTKNKFFVLNKRLNFKSLGSDVRYGVASAKLELPLTARGIIGIAPYSNAPKFGMKGIINQLRLHRFSLVFPSNDRDHGYLFTQTLPQRYLSSQQASFKLVGLKSPVTIFGYFVKVKSIRFYTQQGQTIILTDTANGLMYSDAEHPDGVKVGTKLFAVIDNGTSNFPEFFNYATSPISTKLQSKATYFTSYGAAPVSVTIKLRDVNGQMRRITLKVPKQVAWAFATPNLKQFTSKNSANLPIAFNFSLGFLEHFNLDFVLNQSYTGGTVQFDCKDKYCKIS